MTFLVQDLLTCSSPIIEVLRPFILPLNSFQLQGVGVFEPGRRSSHFYCTGPVETFSSQNSRFSQSLIFRAGPSTLHVTRKRKILNLFWGKFWRFCFISKKIFSRWILLHWVNTKRMANLFGSTWLYVWRFSKGFSLIYFYLFLSIISFFLGRVLACFLAKKFFWFQVGVHSYFPFFLNSKVSLSF